MFKDESIPFCIVIDEDEEKTSENLDLSELLDDMIPELPCCKQCKYFYISSPGDADSFADDIKTDPYLNGYCEALKDELQLFINGFPEEWEPITIGVRQSFYCELFEPREDDA